MAIQASITFGTLPHPFPKLAEPYRMELTGKMREVVVSAINEGIDSHLEAVQFTRYEPEAHPHKLGLLIPDDKSLRVLVRRLGERWEQGSEEAGASASCILETLGVAWV